MNRSFLKSCVLGATLSVVAFGATVGSAVAAEPLKIAHNNWADVMATVSVAKYVLETKLNQPVKMINADIGIQYQSVARGDADVMLGGWMPVTHGAYVAKHKDKLVDVGIRLQSSSEAGMLAALQRAQSGKEWIVTTVWSPHWLFQKWPMRYLKDAKGTLGGEEQIHAYGSQNLAKDFPRATTFLKNFKLELKDVEQLQADAQAANNDYDGVARKFVEANPQKLKAWLQP